MTDKEIIKVLEICGTPGANCKGCPAFPKLVYSISTGGMVGCSRCHEAHLGAKELIERQQAEIERLNKEVDRLSQIVLYNDGIVSDLEKDLFNAKADAIKKFAERLKAKSRYPDGTIYAEWIDIIVKEMVGDAE